MQLGVGAPRQLGRTCSAQGHGVTDTGMRCSRQGHKHCECGSKGLGGCHGKRGLGVACKCVNLALCSQMWPAGTFADADPDVQVGCMSS